MNAKHKQLVKSVLPIIGLLALLGYLVHSEVTYARLKDPTGIATVADYYQRFQMSSRASIVRVDEIEYICLTGPLPPKWSLALPSSPPEYVFDQQGTFVDWCSDPGDTPSWNRKWMTIAKTPLSDAEVRARLGLNP
jgi:hypothetical protein